MTTQIKNFVLFSLLTLAHIACNKNNDSNLNNSKEAVSNFEKYTIAKGDHYCDKNIFANVNYQQLSFVVRFDSSAIYQTADFLNRYDINKLFGFSDNNAEHQDYSARFGWRWNDNALHLFGYVYNKNVNSVKELGIVEIGKDINCSIKVNNDNYIFTLNGTETPMARSSTTATAQGYKLYPYFGGDEVAPHAIYIWIKQLQ